MIRSEIDRRTLMLGSAMVPAGLGLGAGRASNGPDDETFWRDIAREYDVTREVIQLENGNWGMMPRPVHQQYVEHLARVNRDTSFYARRGMGADMAAAKTELAETLGVPADEIAFTRNATEALKALIGGYNRLEPGDAVLYADLDYDSMRRSMDRLALKRGAQVVRIDLPEPADRQSLIDAYAEAFQRHPGIRLVLLTHVSHRTGLVLPVREIAALARERGIDVIVDAAHSWCQLDFALPDLDCDFVGLNGHKWLAAPLGVGFLHIRKTALSKIDFDIASPLDARGVIGERMETGTLNSAAFLTIPAALAFQARIGLSRKSARLRALRDRWVRPLRSVAGLEILTPDEPGSYGAITSFRLSGRTTSQENRLLSQRLLEDHGVFTVERGGAARGACIRVTPSLFNTMDEMDRLRDAIQAVLAA